MSARALPLAAVLVLATAATASPQVCPMTPGNAFAFLAVDPSPASRCPAQPVVHWADASVVYQCNFFLDPDKQIDCSGNPQTCVARCDAAVAEWNQDLTGRFRFVPADAAMPVEFCNEQDGRTSVGGSTQFCDGTAFGSNVLAVALRVNFVSGPMAGELVDTDIVVNQAFAFSRDRFQATLGHEFGHVLGLDHPNQCGLDFNVLMRSASLFDSTNPCFVLTPTGDDVAGARRIYPQMLVVCGDANLDGVVNDVDGVQVLRAAASLASTCTLASCDVNGDGKIDDVDGVNVLRAAASLPSSNNCPAP
jgi:Dockerin type I domain